MKKEKSIRKKKSKNNKKGLIKKFTIRINSALLVFLLLLNITITTHIAFGEKIVYNMLPTHLSLNYGESRKLPVLFDIPDATKYRYIIYSSSSKIKVFLVNKDNNILPTTFKKRDASVTTLITGDNNERKVMEVYLLFKYISPSKGEKVKVNIDISPIYSNFEGNYSSKISSSISYNFLVYLNPPLYNYGNNGENGGSHNANSGSYSSTPSSPPTNTDTSESAGHEYEQANNDNTTGGAWSNEVRENQTTNETGKTEGGEETITLQNNNINKNITQASNETQGKVGENNNRITGKATFFSSPSFTLLLVLLALIGLFIIYKKA